MQRADFTGRLDSRTPLGDGSVRFTARLTRVGVFDYGSHKELRLPEEVFKKDSVDSFRGLAVTDGHRTFVDSENWKTVAVGHVGDDVHQDGDYLVASLVVKDAETLKRIDAKELVELSMGYQVTLDETKGTTADGEKYDAIQRDIFGNHAALGPANWGRAGRSVRLLDGQKDETLYGTAYASAMSTGRTDAPAQQNDDSVRKDLDAARADNEAVRKERDQARTDLDAAKKRADTLEAERDQARKDADDAKKKADAALTAAEASVSARVDLIDAARTVLGADFKAVKADKSTMTDREVRVAALTKLDPELKFDGKSDDYVAARFDLGVEGAKKGASALADVNRITADVPVKADGTKSVLDQALEDQAKKRDAQSKGGAPAGAMVRK